MTQQLFVTAVPDPFVMLDRNREVFSQADINFMLHGTKESIKSAVELRRQLRFVCSVLWSQCEKGKDETLPAYKEYLLRKNSLDKLKKDIKRMEGISRTFKQMRKHVA